MQTISPIIACCILCCCLGYSIGRIRTVQLAANTIQIQEYHTTEKLIPTVRIDGIRNSKVHGAQHGAGRLFIGGTQILSDGEFAVDAPALLKNTVSITIPKGMQYVASRRGTKYYPVTSSQGEQLSPKNRIYFPTAAEAEQAGYKK